MNMGLDVALFDGEEWVDHSSLPYTAEVEIRVLRKIFPAAYWTRRSPKFFDFEAQSDRVKKLIEEFEKDVKSKVALPELTGYTQEERRSYALEWSDDFWRFYEVGLALQKKRKRPCVRIY